MSNDVNSYANVKFPIYQTQVFNNDLFMLISKNISNLSTLTFDDTAVTNPNEIITDTDRYKMKYIINNEATKISYQMANNVLNNYATYCDPGSGGSTLANLNEYSEKYVMGFYGITTYNNPAASFELITDGYTTELNYNTEYNKINIYSTDHSKDTSITTPINNTPNINMAIYECKRHYKDFELNDFSLIPTVVVNPNDELDKLDIVNDKNKLI